MKETHISRVEIENGKLLASIVKGNALNFLNNSTTNNAGGNSQNSESPTLQMMIEL